jgi:hypothetical protein
VKNKKRVNFSKYQTFKHTTERKNKNMVGANPEVQKKKALQSALNPKYISSVTGSPETEINYSIVAGKSESEKPKEESRKSKGENQKGNE